MQSPDFEQNPLLFGQDPEMGIVAVEMDRSGQAVLYRRTEAGLEERREAFRPFLLLRERLPARILPEGAEQTALAGELDYRWRIDLPDWKAFLAARDLLKREYGSGPQAPWEAWNDPVHQYLLTTGKVHFKGLEFSALRRLAVDIETRTGDGFSFPNPEREGDSILSIALAGSDGFQRVLSAHEMSEAELLAAWVEAVQEYDPDIIEGHNLFKFDLSYLAVRARMHKIRLKIGRDGSAMKSRASRLAIAERIVDYPRWEIFGRAIVDTWILVQMYDVSARDLPSYGLKDCARHFGVAEADRVYLAGEEIGPLFARDPETVLTYNLQDARETLALGETLGRSFFQQGKIFPFGYQNIIVRGNATKINSLLVREYLHRGHSLPAPGEFRSSFEGAWTDIFHQGVFRDVQHCDVQSLYPSVMMSYQIRPAADLLDIFLEMLRTLRNFRLAAKRRMKEERAERARRELDALQTTFKVLINSFYGFLGTARHHFSDLEAAARVTARGREILATMVAWLEEQGCQIIELDTDGIYYVPPAEVGDPEEWIARLSSALPQGIEVEYDGDYAAMFSHKKKNYALLDRQGRMTIKGSGLKSRGLEKFQRDHLERLLRALLTGSAESPDRIRDETLTRIEGGRMPVRDLAKTDTLVDSLELYRRKTSEGSRNRAAAYELALASGREYRPGDSVTYYITGTKKSVRGFEAARLVEEFDPAAPDYNIPYYCDKLIKLHEKFAGYFPSGDKSLGAQGDLFGA